MGCKDDISNYSNNDPVTLTVYGKVIDEDGNIIRNATVSLGDQEIYTNYLGMYLLKDIEIPRNGAFLKVTRNDYFTSGRRIQGKDASVKKVDIQLSEGIEVNSFSSSDGGEILLNNEGLKIEFPANGFIDQSGLPYNGNVVPRFTFIPADHENLANIAPGGLSATNTEGEEVILASYGMLGMELNDGDVNLAEGYTAKITMPIPNELLADAPSTIPLWHWNEETGFWEEEGTATLEGNTYVGDVSHFSFWNCDAPFPIVELSFQIVDENNTPITNEYITATINSSGIIKGGTTDKNGYVVNKFPKDEVIQLTMEDNDGCSSLSYFLNENIGPFQENTNAGVFTAMLQEDEIIQVQGTIDNTCMNANEEEYYLIVTSDDNPYCRWEFYIDTDNFDIQFQGNNTGNYTAIFYDVVNFTTSDEYTLDNTMNNIGTISVCDNTGEYLRLEIDDGEELNLIVTNEIELFHDEVNFQIKPVNSTVNLTGFGDGFYNPFGFIINYTDENDRLNTSSLSHLHSYSYYTPTVTYDIYCNNTVNNYLCINQILTLNEFGNSGEYLSGTILGELIKYDTAGASGLRYYTMNFRFKID